MSKRYEVMTTGSIVPAIVTDDREQARKMAKRLRGTIRDTWADRPSAVLTNKGDGEYESKGGAFVVERTESQYDEGRVWWTIKRIVIDNGQRYGDIVDEAETLSDARKIVYALMQKEESA